MNNLESLTNLGLSDKEIRVYLSAVEMGQSLHKTLADKAGIKRPTLYYKVLPALLDKGLVTEAIKGKRKYIVAQDLEPYLALKKSQLEKAEQAVPQLRVLLATASIKPKLLLYEGIEGVKKVWFDHLIQGQPISELVGIENIHPELEKYVKEYYVIERSKRKIPLRMIISGPNVAGILKMKTDPYEFREVKTIDGSAFPFPCGCDIYGDNVSLTIHRQDNGPLGLIIRSKEIATMMSSIFNFIWQQKT